jgi:hypothetical protein
MDDELLPLFPLGTVLFPDSRLPLRIFEARYTDMTRDCLKRKRPFGVCLIREGQEVGSPAVHADTGCLASITECDMEQLGLLNIMTRGGRRFRVTHTEVNRQGLILGRVSLLPDEAETALPGEYAACAGLLRMVVREHGESVFLPPHRFDDAAWVAWRLAELLPLPMETRQSLLEMTGPLERLALLKALLERGGMLSRGAANSED